MYLFSRIVFFMSLYFCVRSVTKILDKPFSNRLSVENEDLFEDRIVGGEPVAIEKYPHQVRYRFDVGGQTFSCGGFIVSEFFIVTAAHCLINVVPNNVTLRVGSAESGKGEIIRVVRVVPHPRYNQPQYDNDVGVMETDVALQFSDRVKPIGLPTVGRPIMGGTQVNVSGWGRTQENGSTSQQLMAVQVPVVYRPMCRMSYMRTLTENMFCAGNYTMGGQGTCQGDSGGAAVQDELAVGIVSYGRGCGRPMNPGVFADVAAPSIRNFIANVTGL